MEILKFRPKVEIVTDHYALAVRCVEIFLADAQLSINARGKFHVAISGGQTPRGFFEMLGKLTAVQRPAWEKVHLFWVDERYVPINSPWSNYRMALETFLDKIDMPQENIHRIPTEYCDFNVAAEVYEESIRRAFALKAGETPQFDLIVLGMGADGHTGSLFSDSYANLDTNDLACVVYVLDEKLNRITLTHPVLCAASHLAVLVSGREKAPILKAVLTSEPDEVLYPIHTIWPVLDKVTWLVDEKAALYLER